MLEYVSHILHQIREVNQGVHRSDPPPVSEPGVHFFIFFNPSISVEHGFKAETFQLGSSVSISPTDAQFPCPGLEHRGTGGGEVTEYLSILARDTVTLAGEEREWTILRLNSAMLAVTTTSITLTLPSILMSTLTVFATVSM